MLRSLILLFSLAAINTTTAQAGDLYQKTVRDAYHKVLMDMVNNELKDIITNPELISAIKQQNRQNALLKQSDIDKLDKQWRDETKSDNRPLIDKTLDTDLSKYLSTIKSGSAGLYTEIFVMDNRGLNVAQSDITSDYWQGDEAKWIKTYQSGKNAVHIGTIKIDESSQEVQVQLSISISDSADRVVGAITFGINLLEYNI